jgi:hypothetical protein
MTLAGMSAWLKDEANVESATELLGRAHAYARGREAVWQFVAQTETGSGTVWTSATVIQIRDEKAGVMHTVERDVSGETPQVVRIVSSLLESKTIISIEERKDSAFSSLSPDEIASVARDVTIAGLNAQNNGSLVEVTMTGSQDSYEIRGAEGLLLTVAVQAPVPPAGGQARILPREKENLLREVLGGINGRGIGTFVDSVPAILQGIRAANTGA